MKRMLYASGSFLTDDSIADALMEYASVLAIVNSADVVRCRGLDDDGNVREIKLLVGPASQLLAMDTSEAEVEMDANETVAELRRRATRRLPSAIDVGDPGSLDAETDAESTGH